MQNQKTIQWSGRIPERSRGDVTGEKGFRRRIRIERRSDIAGRPKLSTRVPDDSAQNFAAFARNVRFRAPERFPQRPARHFLPNAFGHGNPCRDCLDFTTRSGALSIPHIRSARNEGASLLMLPVEDEKIDLLRQSVLIGKSARITVEQCHRFARSKQIKAVAVP